jgi:putative membrane protein
MNGMNNDWGMGSSYSWVIGLIILVLIIWGIIKGLSHKNTPDLPNK